MQMSNKRVRKIVRIDEEKCNGCGDCVPSCAEGAIRVINGKARLMADNLCDGLGACLGHCPMDAITVEERPADDFDHHAVERHLKPTAVPKPAPAAAPVPAFQPIAHAGGCPGSRMRVFDPAPSAPAASQSANLKSQISNLKSSSPSRLRQWPVQLTLLPPQGPLWANADVLLCADCVPFAYPDFHEKLLAGRTLAIACPKLDNCQPYIDKLTTIFASNSIRSITVARMEVPCCSGLTRVAQMALEASGRSDLQVEELILPIRG